MTKTGSSRKKTTGPTSSLPPAVLDVVRGSVSTRRIYKCGVGTVAAIARELVARDFNVAVIARDASERESLEGLLRLLDDSPETDADASGGKSGSATPQWERRWTVFPRYPAGPFDGTAWAKRMSSLYALSRRKKAAGVLLTADNFLPKWPPLDLLEKNHLHLNVGEDMSPELILEQAVQWGYRREKMVSRPGEMAMRGDILDIFAPGYDTPLRLEFFGDSLEEMRLFDTMSQRSRGDLREAVILPITPVLLTDTSRREAESRWTELAERGDMERSMAEALKRVLDEAESGVAADLGGYGGKNIRPGLFYARPTSIEDWLPKDTIFLMPEEDSVKRVLEESAWAWEEYLDREAEEIGLRYPRPLLLRSPGEASVAAPAGKGARRVVFGELRVGVEKDGDDLAERFIGSFDELFPDPAAKDRPWQALVAGLEDWNRTRRQTLLSFQSQGSRKKFMHLAEQEGFRPKTVWHPGERGVYALVSPFRKGLELQWDNVLILGEDVIQPRKSRPPAAPRDFRGLSSFDDLEEGALLVHRDYGLCRFGGLERMDVGGIPNDFLLLFYSGEDRLYLPVDRLSLVQRFKGPDGASPSLDRLGGAGWARTRAKARKAVEQIAKDLVEMYAHRRIAKGYAYGPLDEYYREFEASFGFEETPDQGKAIRDVLEDMEKPEPMDRLVCGDVGFGKTEVAMRAAFRATMDGKQVALLCPTTVLAEQHYQNFRARLSGFPVSVGLLSRFVPRAKQKAVTEAAARGQIDILIGTHRLLSQDVQLPNLGLLVLDEEQRFGVRHKDRIKQFRKNVDVLTLTATPIPRTLQLSISGIRELSVIETPPAERKPVESALIEREPEVLKGIIERELGRKGQVFWVHNRVQGLERVRDYVKKLVPDARIGMAHGQMTERALEETMRQFWHGELDVLVCTAIVESGLDFPRANTLIVDQAQMFGLGQLYQLRGRVGRSDRQAYAYFVVNSVEAIGEIARKRLRIILDMDYLGAGFQVAMEDLRLRGAGNILGEAQSGQMAKVGLDLFLEMLEDEVRRLKGEPPSEETDPELTIGFPAHIPEDYIDDPKERLRYYKRLSSAATSVQRDDLALEIRDRFGHMPDPLMDFLAVLAVKESLSALQVVRADIYPNRIRVSWEEGTSAVPPEKLVGWVAGHQDRARLLPPATLELKFPEDGPIRKRLELARSELVRLGSGADG